MQLVQGFFADRADSDSEVDVMFGVISILMVFVTRWCSLIAEGRWKDVEMAFEDMIDRITANTARSRWKELIQVCKAG